MVEDDRPPELDDKDRIEEQERAERFERGEETLIDGIFSAIEVAGERREENLKKYGLKNPAEQSPEEELEYHRLMDSIDDKQLKLYWDIDKTYRKKKVSTGERYALLRYVAENPIEVPRRHLWRIRRGLDEPLFGVDTKPYIERNYVEKWKVETSVWLCKGCAKELREESEWKPGVELSGYQNKFHQELGNPPFLTDGEQHSYLFEWGEGFYIKRPDPGDIAGLSRFPGSDPHVCERCHVNDVELWREQFGEEE